MPESSAPGGAANRVLLLLALGIALYACYRLLLPFLEPIVLALLVGVLAHPLHDHVLRALRGRRSLAALCSCLALCLLCLLPASLLLAAVIEQAISYAVLLKEWATPDNIQALLQRPWVVDVRALLARLLPAGALEPDRLRAEALALAGGFGREAAGASTAVLGSVSRFVFNGALLVFVLFFVLRDHDRLLSFLYRALPLSRSQEELLLREVRSVSRSALLGTLLTALAQGMLGGIGLWLAGFPALFWGVVMAFASLIPVVGTALVWVPAALYLAGTGDYGWALFLALWGVLVIGAVDNFLRPLLMQGATLNTVLVFFAILGGLQLFGLIGIVYGPLIFAVAMVLFRLYEQEFAAFLDDQERR